MIRKQQNKQNINKCINFCNYNSQINLKGGNIPKFPYKYKSYKDIDFEIKKRYKLLKNYNYLDRLLYDKEYTLRGLEKISHEDKLFLNRYTILLNKDSDYDDFNILSDFFNERCRMKCVLIGRNMSPYDYWKKEYKKIMDFCKKKYNNLDNNNLRESIYELFYNRRGECTSHRPNNIIALMQLFNAKKILDPSMGWGDRLIGAIAGKCEMYVGTDPNPCVHKGYKKIIHVFKAENRTKVYQTKFEEFNNPDNIVFDMVYTSPPYFTMEKYTDHPDQSIIQYSTEKIWFDNFLKILLNKAIQYVKNEGIIAINIGMISNNTYVYDMLDYMKNDKKNDVKYLGIISYSDINLKSINPIFIWQKL
ncbi:methyltransferase domain [Hokovirus HKV1]|uniref:Methyltransferase domain n=1 Tax=Hokovirus HKV1 TaxID=1977638 RepID=A0A1V0SH64_9VIRU|nr:methyltransferase domain [Hokovirus HKV1]